MKLGENERLIRTYRVNEFGKGGIFSPKTVVDVSVTTRRIIHTVTAKSTSQQSVSNVQCFVEDIKDMSYGQSNRIRIPLIVWGAVFALFGLVSIIMSFVGGFNVAPLLFGIILGGVAALLIWLGLSKRTRVWFNISAWVGSKMFGMGSGGSMKTIKLGKPSKFICNGFMQMLDELPAIINDIIDLGDAAADKWADGSTGADEGGDTSYDY